MYSLCIEAVVRAEPNVVWTTLIDVDSFPRWDPREEEDRLDGPLQVGTTGYTKQRGNPGGPITIVAVEPGRGWTAEKALPGGRLLVEHWVEPLEGGRSKVGKRYRVFGPMSLLFRLVFAPRIQRSVPDSFAALEREAQRRSANCD